MVLVQEDHMPLAQVVRVIALCGVPGPGIEVAEVAGRVLQGIVLVVAYGGPRYRLVAPTPLLCYAQRKQDSDTGIQLQRVAQELL